MDTSITKFLEQMTKIQTNLLDFLDHEDSIEEKYQNLINIFDEIKIHDDQFKIKPLFYLILKIVNNHHREPAFFSKIERILHLFKEDMTKYFTNKELFRIFKSNKRLLLFLFEENMIFIDEFIVNEIITNKKYILHKYPMYFQPEIQHFLKQKLFPKDEKKEESEDNEEEEKLAEFLKKEFQDDFYEKRKVGENDEEICKLIQKDLIDEFITYVNKNFYPVTSTINSSIYETNSFLLKQKNVTLIEYASFYGSVQIFNYLRLNGAELKSSLMIYAVHGQNPEIIKFLEKNDKIQFEQIFQESIKCHHIDVANYIQDNYLQDKKEYSNETIISILKYYNFMFIQSNYTNETSFYYLCKYDYYSIVFILLKNADIDINMKIADNNEMYEKKQTALFSAVEKENIEIIKLLLSKNTIDVNILNELNMSLTCILMGYQGRKKQTALHLAIEKENIEIIKLLLSNSTINVNILNETSYAKPKKNIDVQKNQTALYLAVENKNVEIVKHLLLNDKINVNILNKEIRYSVDIDFKKDGKKIEIDQTALYLAIETENIEIIKLLLSNNTIDINILNKKTEGMTIGREERGKERELEQTALYLAVEKENVEIVKLLLSNNTIDVNILNKDSKKRQSEESVMKMKITGQIRKIGLTEEEGMESFISMVYNDFLKEMKKKKMENEEEEEEEETDKNEQIEKTALYLAVEKENVEIIKLLLSNERINVNILNKSESGNKTTLHLAVEKEYIEIIKLLLKNKEIDINIEDDQGKKPIDYTMNDEIKKLLNQ